MSGVGRLGVCPHGRPRSAPGECVQCEWELAKDRELDGLTDEQLIYVWKAIMVTLDDRGWWFNPGEDKWERDDAE